MPQLTSSLRIRLARASSQSELWEQTSAAFQEIGVAAEGAALDDVARLRLVREAAAIAHYAYLQGGESVCSDGTPSGITWDRAHQSAHAVVAHMAQGLLRDQAEAAILLSEHRIARNRWHVDGLKWNIERGEPDYIRESLERLMSHGLGNEDCLTSVFSLSGKEPPEVYKWWMERAHVWRYQGEDERAKRTYYALAKTRWSDVDVDYQDAVLSHYIVSVPCEWFALYLVAFQFLTDTLKDQLRADACGTIDYIERIGRPATRSYPAIHAHHVKHLSICRAVIDDHDAGVGDLAEARGIFESLRLKKPLMICDLFEVLIRARQGAFPGQVRRLATIGADAMGYYPRVTFDAYLFGACIAAVDNDRAGVQRCLRALSISGLASNVLRNRYRHDLLVRLEAGGDAGKTDA